MPEILRPTPRPSRGESLKSLYQNVSTRNAGGFNGIRSHLTNKNIGGMAWGLSKQAGSPIYKSTNSERFLNPVRSDRRANGPYERRFQPNQFVPFQPRGVTSFTPNALQYAQSQYRHSTIQYGYGEIGAANVRTDLTQRGPLNII